MTTVLPLILVVRDDRSVWKSLTRVLAAAGYAVEAFASAREFLARPSLQQLAQLRTDDHLLAFVSSRSGAPRGPLALQPRSI